MEFNLTKAQAALAQLKQNFESGDLAAAKNALAQVKIAMTTFPVLRGQIQNNQSTIDQLTLARDALETAALLSIRLEDSAAFERQVAQVKSYYVDYNTLLDESPNQYLILGLNLVCLLSQNRLPEFHTELELIPFELHNSNPYIKHPLLMEQYLMEGSFNKVLKGFQDVPSPYYTFFTRILQSTVRNEIANSCEKAYHSLPLGHAQKLMMLNDTNQLQAFAAERGWEVQGSRLVFKQEQRHTQDLNSSEIIRQMLDYAHELERIV